MTEIEAQAAWVERVANDTGEVDPDGERHWFDMALGFFLAIGFSTEDAYEMAACAKGVGT